jgi:hypothetical protein
MKTKTKTRRPPIKLPRVSEEMKQWSAMLAQEITTWPRVISRPMFGSLGLYRGKTIFAAIPVTRGIGAANSINFKLESMPPKTAKRLQADPRLAVESKFKAKHWHAFEINSADDLRDALWWLNQAYELAK